MVKAVFALAYYYYRNVKVDTNAIAIEVSGQGNPLGLCYSMFMNSSVQK